MISFLFAFVLNGTAAMLAPAQQAADEYEFVTSINIRPEPSLSERELAAATKYADCLTSPRFPTDGEFSDKMGKCGPYRSQKASSDLHNVFSHIERIVRNLPGSEASLTVAEKINAPNK